MSNHETKGDIGMLDGMLALAPLTGERARAVTQRANIFEMIAIAERAVLAPEEPGALPHDLRAALAARIAHQTGQADLAARLSGAASAATRPLINPDADGAAQGAEAMVQFCDRVARETRDVTAADIDHLRQSGMAEADIVRLCELVAFVSFQARVLAGLQRMETVR